MSWSPSFCTFLTSAMEARQWPLPGGQEVAFWGRSNVGKSSLLNALMGRQKLAHVAKSPGKTRTLNFYQVAPKLRYVDLPGYGHAKVSKSLQALWEQGIIEYIRQRNDLRHVCLLVDGRRGVQPVDHEAMAFLQECHVSFTRVYTKTDLLSRKEKEDLESQSIFPFLFVSAKTGDGIAKLRSYVFKQVKGDQ